MTEIMPSTRTWDQPTEQLAELLLNGALDHERAALALLFRSPMWESDEFRSRYVRPGRLGFDWDHLDHDLVDRYWPLSASVAAQLHIACDLASFLQRQLDMLDTEARRGVETALRIAVGR